MSARIDPHQAGTESPALRSSRDPQGVLIMETLVFAILAVLVLGFLLVLGILGAATVHAAALVVLESRRPALSGQPN
ncbi:hypothetical protein [Azospirillum canadense]|uniref:hypothetical protein n=1 Tax=Azospirillum canadense TaxID=403962 RepID=UPI0022280712|nr:hypothetical protein [Azospirillum canadense]MCW2238967.1 hypothetical protein [Azospirillum canadense]